ncbi:hypothetical protein SNEBB_002462 [Seison nebaliae]|nr:hypothetical protein SNEBB_002462 [Seison nebaliae]
MNRIDSVTDNKEESLFKPSLKRSYNVVGRTTENHIRDRREFFFKVKSRITANQIRAIPMLMIKNYYKPLRTVRL